MYIGYAALHGRYDIDLAAADLQSWINPTLDIPYSWLALGPLSQHPRLLAAFMGLWYGALLAVILAIALLLYRAWPCEQRWTATIIAPIVAATGAAVFSQVGRTFNEIQTATLVMASVLLLAREIDGSTRDSPRRTIMLLAGGLLGAAAGLKLTSAIYAPAAGIALLASVRGDRRFSCLAILVLGVLAGFAIGGGWWSTRLYETFGNPAFPFFNGIFRSPWYPPVDFFDRRFLPHEVWQVLFYPLFWLTKRPMLVTEMGFRDGRVAVSFVLALLVTAMAAGERARQPVRTSGDEPAGHSTSPAQKYLLIFAGCSYVLWLGTTSILRYAIPVEVSAGLAMPLLLSLLVRPSVSGARSRSWIALLTTIGLMFLVSTRYPDWGRMPYGERVASADLSWLRPNSLVIFVGTTVSYVAPLAPNEPGIEYLGWNDVVSQARGYRLAAEVIRRIRMHRGPIALVWSTSGAGWLTTLHDVGLARLQNSCRTFFASYGSVNAQVLHTCAGAVEPPATMVPPA